MTQNTNTTTKINNNSDKESNKTSNSENNNNDKENNKTSNSENSNNSNIEKNNGSVQSQLPLGHLTIIFIDVFFSAMASTAVFSFLPKLVRSFGVRELDVGYYAGSIASSLFVGRLCFSMIWVSYIDELIHRFISFLSFSAIFALFFVHWIITKPLFKNVDISIFNCPSKIHKGVNRRNF